MVYFNMLSWVAVVILSLGYWAQVWKIHIHREVRDISIVSYILLATGFAIMAIKAYFDGSTIFLVKQLSTFLPAVIIIAQIIIHRDDEWHDDADEICANTECGHEIEPHWIFCANCGTKRKGQPHKIPIKSSL